MGYLEYNDYKGSVEYNEEKKCLYGKVIGIKKNIYYEGTSVEDLTNNFKEAIDSFTNQSKRYSKKRKKKERNKELEKALLGYYEIFLKGLDSKETYYNQIETIDKQLCEKDEDEKGVKGLISNAISDIGTKLKCKVITAISQLQSVDNEAANRIVKNISSDQSRKKIELIVSKSIQGEKAEVKEAVLEKLNVVLDDHNHPLKQLMKQFETKYEKISSISATINNSRTYFKRLSKVSLGFFHANTWLSLDDKDERIFCELIAKSALFVSRDIVQAVKNGELGTEKNRDNGGNEYASWDYMERARKIGKKRNEEFEDTSDITKELIKKDYKINEKIKADDNSYANQYIKRAVLVSYQKKYPDNILFKNATWEFFNDGDYEACHVWDKPGDRRYYASIANLILVPRALAQLTDHCDAVKNLLRYEVSLRFGFLPEDEKNNRPSRPSNYKSYVWRDGSGSTKKSKF